MLELKNVSKFYNSNGAMAIGLRNVSLKLNKGEIVAITGDSGSGKSTLLNVITGVDTYEEGEILFYGNETSYFDSNDMDLFRKNNVSFIYQKYNIIDSYTVLENVMIPLRLKGLANDEAKAEALKIIERVGLSTRIKHRGSKLSGGEKQRCVIARALASDSKILACDEPTGNLDSKTGEEIIKLIKEVSDDKLVLIVTHNYDQVKDIVTRRIKISDGEIVEDYNVKNIECNDEENKEMELTSERIGFKECFFYALRNIKSTPKKTLFVSLELFFVSLIALILVLSSFMMANIGNMGSDYNDYSDNRIILYNNDHSPINIDDSKYNDIEYNPFFMDSFNDIYFDGANDKIGLYVTDHKMDGKLVKGSAPKLGEAAIYIGAGDKYFIDMYASYIDSISYLSMKENAGNNRNVKIGRISGIYVLDRLNGLTLYTPSISSSLSNALNMNLVEISYTNDFNKLEPIDKISDFSLDKTTLYLPNNYDIKNIKYNLGIYECMLDLKVVSDNRNKPSLALGKDYFDGALKLICDNYEASIIVDNVDKEIASLKDMGISVSVPVRLKVKTSIDRIILNTFLMISFISILIIYFISYAILSRIYEGKKKDYGVLRALGVVKKDLGLMVKLEMLLLTIVPMITSFITVYLVSLFTKATFMYYFKLPIIILFIVVMLLFGLLIASRFNKRLFKFSVNHTLRDGELE